MNVQITMGDVNKYVLIMKRPISVHAGMDLGQITITFAQVTNRRTLISYNSIARY